MTPAGHCSPSCSETGEGRWGALRTSYYSGLDGSQEAVGSQPNPPSPVPAFSWTGSQRPTKALRWSSGPCTAVPWAHGLLALGTTSPWPSPVGLCPRFWLLAGSTFAKGGEGQTWVLCSLPSPCPTLFSHLSLVTRSLDMGLPDLGKSPERPSPQLK